MTDQRILDRLVAGNLVVFTETSEVWSFVKSTWVKLKVIERESSSSTYRFVKVGCGTKQKKIALHRLVWIAFHRQLVPEGFDVDHVLGANVKHPDAISNLRLLPSSVNRSKQLVMHEDDFDPSKF
jgi:hypothetical protein